MRVLHIIKSEPDETVDRLTEAFADQEVTTVRLDEGAVDWEQLVEEIFAHDKVICWW